MNPKKFKFRVWDRSEKHTYVRVWAGPLDGTLANVGQLMFAHDEWEVFKTALQSMSDTATVDGSQFHFEEDKDAN